MVAMVLGGGMGLQNGSLASLGRQGQLGEAAFGRNGEKVYVNAGNGNLLLQQRDEFLKSAGLDLSLLRTYNSQGRVEGGSGVWRLGVARQVTGLQGGFNQAGSSVRRIGEDGSSALYRYDAGRQAYIGQDGEGADDLLRYDAVRQQWTWTDGATQLSETYDAAAGGRLLLQRDRDGKTLRVIYNAAGQVTRLESSGGEQLAIDYDAQGNITQLRTLWTENGVSHTRTRVRYGYDAQQRLSSVSVDLSPEDGRIDDGKVYTTRYGYDGDSSRLASLSQSDGSRLEFAYRQVGGEWRVSEVRDLDSDGSVRRTRFDYDVGKQQTTITDAAGLQSVWRYDAQGRLLEASSGGQLQLRASYDAQGRVLRLTDARGQATDYQYDERGNRILERDALGQTVRREYDAENRLLSETRYTGLDPDGAGPQTPAGAQTARYVYDAQGRLRFQIDPGGGVTEWRYDALGRPVSQLRYLEGVGQQKTDLAKLTAWAAGQPPERVSRSDSVYDLRGLLSETVRYARLDAKGQGVRDGGEQRVRYLYDQHGNLLQQWDGRGASVQYRYDGLNRLTRQTDALGNSTVTVYLDAKRQTQVTLANGLTMLRQYDSAGRLLAQTEQDAGGPLGSTRYLYDAMGRLLRSTDPTGQHQYQLYDAQGRKQAEIDATGALTEIRYNAVNQIIRRTRYANRIDLSLLGKDPARWSLETLRPQAGNDDRIEHLLYDAAGRLARSIDASGAVIDTHYDGRGQIIGTTRYAAWLDAKQQQALQAHEGELSLDNANARVAANGQDRAERRLYDAAGRLQAELDGEGYLTEHRYNSAGQRLASLRYATAAPASARARGGLDALRPQPDAQDQTVSYYYDGHGQQTGEVDAEGYLNETRYDAAGRVQQHIRYANRAKAGDTLAARRPAVNANDQGLLYEYDAAGRLTQQLRQPDGFTTRYQYDSQGRLTQTVRQAGEDSRSQLQRYDKQGRLIAELAGEGVQALAALGGAPSQARVDAVWSRWGSRHYYDAAGRRTATLSPNGVDGQGERTLYFYNAAGLQTHTVNALGEVSDTRYDAFGQIVGQLSYDRRLSAAQLSGLSGGLQSQIAPLLLELAQAGFSRQSYQYGRRGALFSQTDALGRETDRWTYNAFGERQDHTRLDGGRQQLLYDRRGLVVQQQDDVDGLKLQRQTRYDAFGRAWEQTDPRGRIQRREYDRLGRQIVSQDASGARQQTVYDAFGRVLEHTDALGYVTRSRYDDKTGRLTVTDANGIATVTERNGHGDVVTVIDGRGHATRYQYDRDGRRIGQNKPLGYSEQWQYNSAGRLMESRDANGARTVYVYDAVGRVLQRTIDPTGLKLSSRTEYDARGRVLRQIDANGGVTETRYDANGRVMETVRDATGLKLATAYRYDGQGRTVSVTEAAGTKQARTTEYRYDRQGRRLSEILDPGGAKLTTRYGYDGNGNVTSQTDAGGNVTRYVYDANNRQVYSIDALGYVVETAYDAAGQILRTTRYAQALKPSLLASPDALADPAPHLTASAADQTERRVYDKAGRLLQRIDPQGYLTQYSYDKGGNLAWVSRFANAVQGTFIDGQLVARLDSLPDSGAPAGAYLLTGGADRGEFQLYDALGRLQLSRDARGYATEYQYDAAGLLQQRTQYANPVQKKTSTNQMPARIDRIEQAPADGSSYILRSAADRKEFFAYDTAGRAVFSVDAEGYATRRSYDGLGNVVETRRHANKSIANLGWMQVNQTLYAYLFGRAADSPSLLHDKAAADPAARADALMASAEFEKKVGKLDPPKLAAWIYQTVYNRAGTAQELEAAVARLNGGESRGSVFWSLLQQADIQQVAPSADIGRALNDWRVLAEGTSYRRNDQVSRQQFDAAGRLTHSVDAAGYVTAYRYDAAGQRVETRRYAQRLWPEPDAQNSAEANAEWVDYNKRLYAYVLGRAPANLEELNARAANQSERAQALLSSPEFETRHGKLDDAAFIDWAFRRIVVRTPSQSERNTWQTNLGPNGISRGELVKYLLSWRLELKRPVEQDIRQAQNDWRVLAQIKTSAQDQVVRTAYDAAGRLISETRGDGNKLAAATRYQLDAQGKRVVETDANGRTTRRDYDLLGRLIRETDALGGVTATEYDAFGNAVKITDPRGYSGYNYYDALGRQTLHVDPEGYATGTEYDALGNTTRITRYATRVDTAALKPGVAPTLIVDAQRDAVTRIEHDALGHQTVLTDAEGGVEKMAYDAFGNKTVYTNQLGGGYHYIYDAQGRVLKETSPLGIVKRFEYDGFGNRTLQVEAEGKPEQRTTRYQYDGNNRLTRQTGDAVPIYTLDGGEATVSPSQSWRYDAAGRQIEFTDANGKITRSRYDALGRKVAERNGDGVLSEWDYDAAGNVKAQRVYASPVGLPAEGGVPAPANADVRETRYVYDGNNRLIETRLPAQTVGQRDAASGQYTVATQDLVSRQRYDANGNLIETTDARGGRSLHYYDRAGHKLLSVDAAGYATAWDYDAGGRAIRETRYGSALSGAYDSATPLDTLRQQLKPQANDRVRETDYDRMGRISVERTLKLQVASADGQSQSEVAASTRYQYNALGKVTQKTDAAGQVTDWRYDAQGRETRRQDAVFTDYLGRAVRPTSDSEYNGLDQLSRQIRHGLDEASEADDQIVRYQYGIGGRLLSQSDAMGNGIRYDYDAAGLLTRTQRARRQADGSEVNDVTGYRYDAAGRQTERRDQATSMRFETRYNAYGEIAGKRTSADGQGAWQEFADYDGAGRVFRRNEGGVTRAYLYDANGNATLQIESDSVDLRQMSRDQILAAINRPDSGLRLTVSEYDGRNQRVATYQPKMVNARDQALVQAERWVSAVPQEGSGGVVSAGASKIKENEQSSPLALGGVALGGGVVSGSVTLTPTAVLREDREELGSSRKFDVYLQEMNVNVNLPPLPEYGDDTYQVVITFPGRRVVSRTLTVPANGVLNTPVSMLYAQFVFAGSQNWPDSAVLGFEVAVYKTARNAATNTTQSLMLFQSSGQFSGAAIRNHTSSSYNGVFGANQLHFRSPDSRIAKVLLLTRPANSGEGWRRDEMPLLTLNGQVQSSWFALDWGGLPRGNLEYRLLALDAAGTVLFGQQNPSGAFLALSGSKPVFPQPASALPLGQYGSAVLGKDGAVNLYGLGSAVVRANIRFRLQGGSWGALQNIAATIGNGWFQFLPSNYGLAAGQTWEYELERLDAKGQSLGAVVGAFRPGEANSLSQPVAWRDQPQIVHIGGNQPAAASRGLIRYRKPGGAWAEAPLSRAANGEWDWDSSTLAKGLSAPTVYEFEYQLFDAKGLMLNRAGGQLTLGGGAVSVNSKGLTLPLLVSFNPPQTQAAQLLLSYRSKGSQGAWTQVALSRNGQGQFALDANALAAGDYEYRYQLADAQGALLTGADGSALDVSGYLRRHSGVDSARLNWVITGTSQSEHNIIRRQQYNAFGEVSSETDGRGNVTTFEYSAFGQLLAKQDPETAITLADGSSVQRAPRTQYRYDALGNLVATVDANGQLNRQSWLAGGERGQGKSGGEIHADGGVKQLGYDVFGNLRVSVDEIGRRSDYRYNANNQLIRQDRAARADGRRGVDEYDYDSAGQRIVHRSTSDGKDSLADTTQYDSLGRVLATVSAAGRRVAYRYQWDAAIAGAGGIVVGGWRSVKTDANGRSQTDDVSLFGHKVAHVDLGNHRFSYRYNYAGQVAEQSGSTGQHITYQYYGNGYLKSLSDHALDSYTLYEYDQDGNKTFEGYTSLNSQSREFYQYADIQYDALGRVTRIKDPKFLITYRYDAVGNRLNVNSVYHDGVNGQQRTQDYWYRYDSMNRFVTTKGSLVNGQIGRGPQGGDGVDLLYNAAGERVQATYAANGNVETYSYSADGYLESTRINGKLAAQRDNDLLGRATAYREYRWNGDGGVSSQTQSRYDADHKLLQQTRDGASTIYHYLADGTLDRSVQTDSRTTVTSYYGYEWWDEAKQSTITSKPYNKDAPNWQSGYSHLRYNVNGHLVEARDETKNRSLRYVNNAQGLVLKREEIAKGSTYKRQDYYFLDGKQIGSVGNDGASRVDYAQALAQRPIGNRKDQYREGQPVNSADFDQNYEPIGPHYPGQTPGFVTVKAGDSLQSLAASLWGDQAMWYLLADANSLSGSEALMAGQVLKVPNKVTNVHNNSGTYRVYNPGEAIGDVTPTLPDPPPPPQRGGGGGGRCGGFGSIFVAIVAVVAVVTLGPIFSQSLIPVLGAAPVAAGTAAAATVTASAAATFAGYAAAGALASMAGQGVAMAMGMQDQFSWSQVGMNALGAGVSAGMGAGMLGDPLKNAPIALRAAAGNAVTQGVAVATGLQKRFSWTAVAASGVGALASSQVNFGTQNDLSTLDTRNDSFTSLAQGTARGLVSGGIQSQLTGQRPNWSAIAAESFGSALGDQVVDGIQSRDRERQQQQARLAEAMRQQLSAAQQTRYAQNGMIVADAGNRRGWREILSDAKPGFSVENDMMAQRATAGKAAPDLVDQNTERSKGKKGGLTKAEAEYAANWKLPTAESQALKNVYPEMLFSLPAIGRGIVAQGASLWSKFATAMFGGGVNYATQKVLTPDQPVNWLDVGLGAATGWWTNGASLGGTVAFNTYSASVGAGFQGQNPLPSMAGAAVGSVVGFGVGSAITGRLDPVFNPWYRPLWITVGPYGIQGWNASSPVPNAIGLLGGGLGQEVSNSVIVNGMKNGR